MNFSLIFPKDSEGIFDSAIVGKFGGATVRIYKLAKELSKRKNIKIITIPMNDSLALISAESTAKIEPIIEDIVQSLKDYAVNN